ncbi:MAG: 16S rRNA (guanine(966)-N(2))-methyltransferase RsmD [Eubacteriales bacterium]|nr:16S rRNA (guanine(966)-N(2))-methyltransferase RsmD [Eubacteriales bacterium]
MGRVIAGRLRGRKLKTVPGMSTRPTTDRCKEALFNRIQMEVQDADFLDLCAGSGQIGIEALSRGARSVCFVEKSRQAARVIESNLQELGLEDSAELLRMDLKSALQFLDRRQSSFDLIFCDPPYAEVNLLLPKILKTLRQTKLWRPEGLFILESGLVESGRFLENFAWEAEQVRCLASCPYGAALLSFIVHL